MGLKTRMMGLPGREKVR